jgi:transcriptional antiterminator NusG
MDDKNQNNSNRQEDQKIRESENQTSDISQVSDTPASSGTPSPSGFSEPSKSDNPNARWYVVHTYSGHENKVAATLKQRVESEHLEEKILDVLVPVQDKIEIKGGKKATIKEKIFPGYILVKMVLDDTSWLAVRTTQGVTSFVGIGNKPTPISEKEVQTIVKFTMEEAPTYKQVFSVSDAVKIVDGPFAEFIGKIDNVDEEKGKVKVLVSIFGRETPVELDFLQIQKI